MTMTETDMGAEVDGAGDGSPGVFAGAAPVWLNIDGIHPAGSLDWMSGAEAGALRILAEVRRFCDRFGDDIRSYNERTASAELPDEVFPMVDVVTGWDDNVLAWFFLTIGLLEELLPVSGASGDHLAELRERHDRLVWMVAEIAGSEGGEVD